MEEPSTQGHNHKRIKSFLGYATIFIIFIFFVSYFVGYKAGKDIAFRENARDANEACAKLPEECK